ncbi:hypothetical protein DFP94_101214 [Fontibacillus phaseoli]|uniref:Uncharacterized protein n=1 Tax=Fontibacillus phaseoli TaxID=1416533 RepID=A0A369BSQ6_9BACL|nr:hypothetical protein DFP94_101214 [Fontibacillus phaseoli]
MHCLAQLPCREVYLLACLRIRPQQAAAVPAWRMLRSAKIAIVGPARHGDFDAADNERSPPPT